MDEKTCLYRDYYHYYYYQSTYRQNENRAEFLHLPWSIWDLVVQIWPEFFLEFRVYARKA